MFCGSGVSSTTGISSCGGLLQDTLSQDEVRKLQLVQPGQRNSVFPSRAGPFLGVQFCLCKRLPQLFLFIFLKVNDVGSANLFFSKNHLFRDSFSLKLFHSLLYPSSHRGCCAGAFTCHLEAGQPNFGGSSHCSAKLRLMAKISQHLFLCVAAACWSLLLFFFSPSSLVFAVG